MQNGTLIIGTVAEHGQEEKKQGRGEKTVIEMGGHGMEDEGFAEILEEKGNGQAYFSSGPVCRTKQAALLFPDK